MTDIISGITTALDIATKLRTLNRKVGEAEFKMFLADLSLALGDAKLEAANLKSEVADLKDQNAALQKQLKQRVDPEPDIDDGCYVFDDSGRRYCTACFDLKKQKVLVSAKTGPFKAFGRWSCPSCKANFGETTPSSTHVPSTRTGFNRGD